MNLFTTLTAVIAANAAVIIVAPSDAFSHETLSPHVHDEGVAPQSRMRFDALKELAPSALVARGQAIGERVARKLELVANPKDLPLGPEVVPLKRVADPELPNPMVLEYKILTHVEALARKYGKLDQMAKTCNVRGSYFEEAALADVLGGKIDTGTLDAAKRAYREGKAEQVPPCDAIADDMNAIMTNLSRHKEIISGTSSLLELVRADLKRQREGGSSEAEGKE